MTSERVVAVALLTKKDVRLLGPTFDRLWPLEDTPCFSALLEAIDKAEAEAELKHKPAAAAGPINE